MHWGLPVTVSIESVDFGSSESESGASVSSTTLAWASEERSPSGSWWARMFCQLAGWFLNEMQYLKISEVLEYSFPSLKKKIQ